MVLEKAVPCVVRERNGGRELLIFRHPFVGVQIPKGTVEPGEDVADAAIRELEEESGIATIASSVKVGTWDRIMDAPAESGSQVGDLHRWHIFVIRTPEDLPERWDHVAIGSEEEDGLVFSYLWRRLDPSLVDTLNPLFAGTVAVLLHHFGLA